MTRNNKNKIMKYIKILDEKQIKQFKVIFSYHNQSLTIDQILDNMDSSHFSNALRLCKNSAEANLINCSKHLISDNYGNEHEDVA